MKINHPSLTFTFCLLITSPTHATEFSYTYAELAAIISETDSHQETTQGYQRSFSRRLSGSIAISKSVNITARYQTTTAGC